jgi:hypothetical protein
MAYMFSFGTYQKDIFKNEITPPWPYKTWEAKKNAKVERVGDKPKRLIDLPCDVLEGVV